jgi:hypothetical protein
MVTEPALTSAGRNSAGVCVNPEGFGVTGQIALQCAPGSWSARGSMLPCQPCAAGRNTTATLTEQVAATDCFVIDGYGVFDQAGQTAAAQWYDAGVSVLSSAAKADLEVAMCPVGRYSDSQDRHSDTAARCVTCPDGSVTEETGSTDLSQCTGTDLAWQLLVVDLHCSVVVCCLLCSLCTVHACHCTCVRRPKQRTVLDVLVSSEQA